ncbi:MAG: hypothetical protein U1F61_06025 [Opitutaceae bacterium]
MGSGTFAWLQRQACLAIACAAVSMGTSAVGLEAEAGAFPNGGRETPLARPFPALETLGDQPWLLAELPGVTILALASQRETTRFIEVFQDFQMFFFELVPEIPRPGAHPAFTVVLRSPTLDKRVDPQGDPLRLPGEGMRLHPFGDTQFDVCPTVPPRRRTVDFGRHGLPSEEDTDYVTSTEEQWAEKVYDGYWRRLLALHPELPDWYRTGLERSWITLDPYASRPEVHCSSTLNVLQEENRRQEHYPSEEKKEWRPWPLERFFSTTRPNLAVKQLQTNPPERASFEDQCVLFLHWGLRGGDGAHRAAFHRFVAAASERSVDDALVRRCFGYGYAEAQARFEAFARQEIKTGSTTSIRIPRRGLDFLVSDNLRRRKREPAVVGPAARNDTVRILAEIQLWRYAQGPDDAIRRWQGGTSPYLIHDTPSRRLTGPDTRDVMKGLWGDRRDLSPTHQAILAQSQTLLRQEGGKDPQTMATRGLIELALGNPAEARSWLEQATAAQVVRPDAYAELARLRLGEAILALKGATGHLSREQLLPVRELLHEALRQWPEMWLSHRLLAHQWTWSEEAPPGEELARLARVARLYPKDQRMLLEVADLYTRAGQPQEAAALSTVAQGWAPPPRPPSTRPSTRPKAGARPLTPGT